MTTALYNSIYQEIFDFLFETFFRKQKEGEAFFMNLYPNMYDGVDADNFISLSWEYEHHLSFEINREEQIEVHLLLKIRDFQAQKTEVENGRIKIKNISFFKDEGGIDNIIEGIKKQTNIPLNKNIKTALYSFNDFDTPIAYDLFYTYPKLKVKGIIPFLKNFIETDKKNITAYFKDKYEIYNEDNVSEFEVFLVEEKHKQLMKKYSQKYDEIPPVLPFSLLDILIRDFRGIKNLAIENIPPNTKWVFLTGENGFGKTTILQAILFGLFGFEEEKNDTDTSKAAFETIYYNKKVSEKPCVNLSYSLKGKKITSLKGNIAAFGSERLLARERNEMPITANLMRGSETTLLQIDGELYRNGINPDNNVLYPRFRLMRNVLCSLIPHLKDIKADGVLRKTLYFEQDENGSELPAVSFEKLAAGFKNIINLVGNMVMLLSANNKNIENATDLAGVTIIDEIDLHLHPKMQRFLVEKLTRLFPKVQFIVSTHSPIPLLGAPKETVILHVDRTKEKGITVERLDNIMEDKNLSANTLLASPIFNFSS